VIVSRAWLGAAPVHLSDLATAAPDKPAVITADGSRVVTFRQLDERSRQMSRLLAEHRIGPRDHIAVFMANRPEYFEIAWGAQRRGVYWTPVNWHLTADEAGYIVGDCGARLVIASPETAEVAAQLAAQIPGLVAYVACAGQADEAVRHGLRSLEAALDDLSAGPIADETEGHTFFYSSGTTGRPKGIKPDFAFPPFGAGVGLELRMQAAYGFAADTVYLCPAPLYHAAPIGWSMGTLRLGGTVVLMERFDPVACLQAIERHRVTAGQFVPTHFVRMLKLTPDQRARFDVSSLRTVVHAAAPCPVEVKQQMMDWLGPVLYEYYAGSEGNGSTMVRPDEWLAHPGTVGRALVGVVHILADDGTELPPGEDGTIFFEGNNFEYHNDPVKTASSRNDKGWTTLGDIGHLDDEGFLYLSDRRADLIISGGVNIYPAEVEEALIMHPAVADVAVIGVPDAEMGQSVLAIVQPASQGTLPGDLAAELIAHCRSRLAAYKAPRAVEFAAELPRTPTGKLLRRKLRDERLAR
jgi:long-chain acyl-CoA synthetase